VTHVAVVGAGLAGLVLARRLRERVEVTVVEKSRSLGGRMATRRYGRYQFDHGAQYFRARTSAFRTFVSALIEEGVVAPWPARVVEVAGSAIVHELAEDPDSPRLVALPGMNGLGRHLATGVRVRRQRPVASLVRAGMGWRLLDAAGAVVTEADWVIVTAPAPQAYSLLPEDFAGASQIGAVPMSGCFALMLGLRRKLPLAWQAARVSGGSISWIAVDSSKPGRPGACSIVVHAAPDWSEAHMDAEPADTEAAMIEAASEVIGEALADAEVRRLHRWRYAMADPRTGPACFVDPDRQLAVCGDWCVDGRVEAAFISAMDLAARLEQVL
jgi:predicted NAD/FAD-dependent oxidoreductase